MAGIRISILKLTPCCFAFAKQNGGGQFENVKIKVQNAKLRNPDGVGMVVL